MWYPQQRGNVAVPARLLNDALAGIHENQGQAGGRCACYHVAGVLNMPWGIRNDKATFGCRKITIGYIYGYALLSLRSQPVSQVCQVNLSFPAQEAGTTERLKLIFKNQFAVVQESTDESTFAVIHTTAGEESQQLNGILAFRYSSRHQKYPSRFRSSIAVSERRSSALAPRSVIRRVAISSMISLTVEDSDSIPAVLTISPTVRKRMDFC